MSTITAGELDRAMLQYRKVLKSPKGGVTKAVFEALKTFERSRTVLPMGKMTRRRLEEQVVYLFFLITSIRSNLKGGVPLEVLPPQAVHRYQCPSTRFGKKFGPCDCGGKELNQRIDRALRSIQKTVKWGRR